MEDCFVKTRLISFDDDTENVLLIILMYIQIGNIHMYSGYPKLKSIFGFWSHSHTTFKPCVNSLKL